MKNNNVLKVGKLHNPDIRLKDIKNWQITTVILGHGEPVEDIYLHF